MPKTPELFTGELVQSRRIIYQPSQFAVENLVYLQETGNLTALKPHVSSRKGLASHLFFVVTEGEGKLTYEGQHFLLKKGDCVFIDCRVPYSQGSSKEKLWSLKWAHFDGKTMPGIYGKYRERGGTPVICNGDSEKLENLLDSLFETAASSSYVRDMQINSVLCELLSKIMEESWNPDSVKKGSTKCLDTGAVKNYIDSSFTKQISLESVAREFNVNKSYLVRTFKDDFGITVNNYILQQRILMAKNELRFTGKTLDLIAEECGFSDSNYFIRMFKKLEGITPGEYRKTW